MDKEGTASATDKANAEEAERKAGSHAIPPELDPAIRNGTTSGATASTSTRRLTTTTASIHHKLLQADLEKDGLGGAFCPRSKRNSSFCASEQPGQADVPSISHAQSEVPIDLDDDKIQQSYKDLSLSAQLLSRHLEARQTKMDIKKILIVVKHHDDSLPPRASELVAWLLAQPESFTVYVEDMLRSTESFNAEGLIRDLKDGDKRIKYWTKDFCIETAQSIDLVITLGGDGTVLFASCMFQHVVPPVVSFALGSFGFMTRHDFSEHRTILRKMFSEGFSVCLRARFAGRVMRSIPNDMPVEGRNLEAEMLKPNPNVATHELVEEFTALNEIVVDRGKNSTVSLTDIYTLDQRVASVMADGLIISTPTGSTAYNLAAGGSLCHPDMSAILITPICPHSLTLRPIMLPDSMVIRLGLPYHARTTSSASFDGRQTVELQRGDYVQVSVSRFPFAVVQSDGGCDKDWFESIGRDFGWGIRKV